VLALKLHAGMVSVTRTMTSQIRGLYLFMPLTLPYAHSLLGRSLESKRPAPATLRK
jgi:hypothetical protein